MKKSLVKSVCQDILGIEAGEASRRKMVPGFNAAKMDEDNLELARADAVRIIKLKSFPNAIVKDDLTIVFANDSFYEKFFPTKGRKSFSPELGDSLDNSGAGANH